MKKVTLIGLIVGCLIVLSTKEGYSQGKTMLVPPYSQFANTWCWSACMEMVMDFHWPNGSNTPNALSQGRLVLRYGTISGLQYTVNCTTCGKTFPVKAANPTPSDQCYFPIPFSTGNPLLPDYIDRLFSMYNFRSRQVINIGRSAIDWGQIKQQIEDCRPFIIFVNPANGFGTNNDHALVVKGYYTQSNTNYIVTNDPWFPCNGGRQNSIFPFSIFQPSYVASPEYPINKVWSAVLDIHPDSIFQNFSNCHSCEVLARVYDTISPRRDFFSETSPFTSIYKRGSLGGGGSDDFIQNDTIPKGELDLLDKIKNKPELTIGFKENLIDQRTLDRYLSQENYFASEVNFLSAYKLSKCLCFKRKTVEKMVTHQEEVLEVVSGPVGPEIVSSLQKNKNGLWELSKISNYTSLKKVIKVKTNGNKSTEITLNNSLGSDKVIRATPYKLIKIPPFYYEFYSFQHEGETLITPADNYQELKLEANVAYPEKDVINILGKISNDYYHTNQRLAKSQYKNMEVDFPLKGVVFPTSYGKTK